VLCKHLVCLGYGLGSPRLCNRVVWPGYRLDGSWLGCWQGQDNFHIGSFGARPASCAVATGDSFPEGKVFRHAADPQLHLVLQLTVSAADPLLHCMLSWHVQWQLYLCFQGGRVLAIRPKCWWYRYWYRHQSPRLHSISLKTVTLKRAELSGFMGMSYCTCTETDIAAWSVMYRMAWALDSHILATVSTINLQTSLRVIIIQSVCACARACARACVRARACTCACVLQGTVVLWGSEMTYWRVCLQLNLQDPYFMWSQ
jgi:hypothetical protein